MKKYFCPALFFSFLFIQQVWGQSNAYVEVKLKNVSDTVLGRRSLLLPEPFDGIKAMRKLFPGPRIARVYEYKGKQGYVVKTPAFIRVVKK